MKKRLLPALFTLVLIELSINAPAQIYVKHNATGANTGISWTDAYIDLKTALTSATAGDQIWVAAGTYKPAAPGGVSTETFTLNKTIQLLGGFAGTETSAGQRDPVANPTILSGDLNGNDVDDDFSAATRSDNVQHVLTINAGATIGTEVDGFTIQGGHADGGASNNGGGVYCFGAPTIKNCIFRQNFCQGGGAGFYANGASAQGFVIEICRFESNLASTAAGSARGGGLYVTNVKGVGFILKETAFIENLADWEGGLSVFNSNGTVEGTTFTNNSTPRHGGGLRINYQAGHDNLHFQVRNCSFENNKASFGGGMYGLLQSQNCSVEVVNSKFIENAVEDMQLSGWGQSDGGLGFTLPPTASDIQIRIDSCLFEGNASSNNFSAIGFVSSGNNILWTLTNSTFRQNTNTYYATVGLWPEAGKTLNATIENCLFENNISQYASAGLDLGPSGAGNDLNYTVRNCIFRNNHAAALAGALTIWAVEDNKVNFTIEDCLLEGNSAGETAGGVWVTTSSDEFTARFDRCIFRNNDSPWGSAVGVYQYDLSEYTLPEGAVVSIENCLLEGNTSSTAIALDSFPGFRLINSTIAYNHGGIQVSDSSGLSLQNTILYNPGYLEYEALTNDVAFTSNGGNLIGDLSLSGQLLVSDQENLDPVFVGAGDYHLDTGSPGIDQGVDLGNLSAFDLDGYQRVVGASVDIGAYENQTLGSKVDPAELLSVSPNPATEFLTILLPESGALALDLQVFDMEGRELLRRNLAAGQVLDVRDLLPGTFTLKVVAGERVFVGKFVKQ